MNTKMPLKVVSDDEAARMVEKDDTAVLVCLNAEDDPGIFSDNITGICSECQTPIIYRPHNNVGDFRPVCQQCAGLLAADAIQRGENVERIVTEKTNAEVDAYFATQRIKKLQ
jgi:hypothetical protein